MRRKGEPDGNRIRLPGEAVHLLDCDLVDLIVDLQSERSRS